MICALVFHEIRPSETILMAWLFAIVCDTRVPIFHIKTARVAYILICKQFGDVGKKLVTLPGRWIGSRGDVGDDAVVTNVWNGGRHQGSTTFATACAVRMSTATASSAMTNAARRVVGLLLEPM